MQEPSLVCPPHVDHILYMGRVCETTQEPWTSCAPWSCTRCVALSRMLVRSFRMVLINWKYSSRRVPVSCSRLLPTSTFEA